MSIKAFRHGSSDKIAANAVPARVQEIFKDHVSSTEAPLILLVYHEEETINYIRNMDVDISGWRTGLRDLLIPDRLQVSFSSQKTQCRKRQLIKSKADTRPLSSKEIQQYFVPYRQ